jgi:hypothetical protein
MRLAGKQKLGYFPLPFAQAERIRRFLQFPLSGYAALDPCIAMCAIAGLLDGVFGSGEDRHIATWRSVKVTDCSEEVEEDGTIIRRERERFTNELTLLYSSGKTATLR